MNKNIPACTYEESGLCSSKILAALPEAFPWRSHISCYDSIDSTNTAAKKAAAAGAPEGTVLIANSQSAGRGRLGRSFFSPAGMGIYLSVVLHPECLPRELMHLTCAAAVAACNAVTRYCGLRPGIKWTNDLVLGSKKLAGILTELSVNSTTGLVEYAVVGIGINCCHDVQDFPPEIRNIATSIAIETGTCVDRNSLCAAMIVALSEMRQTLLKEKPQIMQVYRKNCITLGQSVSIVGSGPVRHAKAMDIDPDGGLLVRYDSGESGTITSGEVSVRGMYGYV